MGSRLEANSRSVRKRIENHAFDDEDGEEYEGSAFGGFGDYFRRKKIKLQNLDADVRARSDKPKIFKNIVAHVNGYTQPSLQDLHHLIVQHGGGFMQYLDGKTVVTHIIASSLTPKKAVEFRKYRIVKPAWVVDSIQAGKLLPWNDYRVVDEGETQKVLAFGGGMITSQANVKARGYRDQTDSSYYTHQLKGSQSGSPASPASTPKSSAAIRSRFSKQRLPTPEDAIEDMLPCHQPELRASDKEGTPDKIDSPPKASSYLAPQEDGKDVVPTRETLQNADGNLYDNTTPPNAQQEPSLSLESEERLDDISAEEQASSTTKKRPLTAEEHNAILLSDPKMRKSTVVDPNFLEQYYRESRLHHLSTWKAELKSELQAMANEKSASQRAKQKPPAGTRRYVMHIDFDSFFAAVSLQKHPEFKDKPAVVAHGNGNGSEIASCNYPARQFGIKNGMWMRRAHELCPDLKILPYDFPAYEAASRDFYRAIIATDGVVQSVSIDEALIDVSNLCIAAGGSDGRQMSEGSIYREQAKADEIAQSLRDQVKAKTDCNVSVGIGANILQAKVALRKAKPAGQYQLKPEEVLDFMGQLQVQDLPGVAWSTGGKLEELGVKYVKDLRELSKQRLVQAMGPKTGEKLWEYSRGIDRQEVGEQVVRKSVSAEVNWGVRFATQEQAEEFIGSICGELEKRLLKEKVKGKQFTIKIMRRSVDAPLDPPKHLGHGKCDTFNKSVSLGVATNSRETLTREALAVLRGFGFSPGELRGIGVQMTKLEPMKFTTDGTLEGSQRRLQFKATTAQPTHSHAAPKVFDVDPIQDDPETPKKFKVIESIEDRPISFGAKELNQSTPSRRPLNMLGTQFILPSQVDPEVLAELPNDIRSKLLRQVRQSSPTPAPHSSFKAAAVPFALTALPAQSQLDPEILAALPADVRAEVLAQYAAGATPSSPSHRSRVSDQTVPQSPRKNRVIGVPIKKPAPPVKRGRGRPPKSAQLAAAAAATTTTKSGNTLTQANFISVRNPARDAASREASADPNNTPSDAPTTVNDAEPDPEFLAALPEDLRREVIEEHKRKKLQASRLAIFRKQKQSAAAQPSAPRPVQTIKVPRPPRPTFTTQKLSTERDLRAAIKEWVLEFAEEGPYAEDVGALVKYLGKVVGEERDLGKAVGVVRWLEWVVGDAGESEDKDKRFEFEREKWGDAVVRVKKGVCGAAGGKGLGLVNFD